MSIDTELFCEFCKTSCDSIHGKNAIRTSISSLAFWRVPAAITGFIISIVVFTLQAQSGWRFSHVSEEVFKSHPSLANFNSPCAMPLKADVVVIVTASVHSAPSAINASLLAFAGVPVSDLELHNGGSASLCLAVGDRRQPALTAIMEN